MSKRDTISIRLRKDQINRLNILRAALEEKMAKEYTLSELLEKVVDDFLETK